MGFGSKQSKMQLALGVGLALLAWSSPAWALSLSDESCEAPCVESCIASQCQTHPTGISEPGIPEEKPPCEAQCISQCQDRCNTPIVEPLHPVAQ